jgi:hypothetical protein
MKAIIMLLAASLAAGCTHNGGPEAKAQAAKADAALASALSGRIAGPPQDCVSEPELGGNKAYGRDVIVFSGRVEDVLYVNRLAGGCAGLDFGWAVKAKTPATRLCRGDIVTVFDPISGAEFGSCGLGQFTPYRPAR